jgi:hypothetical protein
MKFSYLIPVVVFLVGCSQSEPRESRSGSSESSGTQATAPAQSEPGFDDLVGAAQGFFINICLENGVSPNNRARLMACAEREWRAAR